MSKLKTQIELILKLINDHKKSKPLHSEDCEFLHNQYSTMLRRHLSNDKEFAELVYWNKWFAPRIVYDGIGNQALHDEIINLNLLFENEKSNP